MLTRAFTTKSTLATVVALTGLGVAALNLNAKSEAAKKAQAATGTGQSFALGGCERSGETDPYYQLFSFSRNTTLRFLCDTGGGV
ncbi:hypothetical protein DFP73DRAFT_598954 [Morchella snyderi]|nr:hypothetical protein DFP73DRAFT_598954 [Morchella snyderi]